jgi:hypothetical protein
LSAKIQHPLAERKCTRCKVVKPAEQFYKSQNMPGGIGYTCKPCNRKFSSDYKRRHPEKTRAYRDAYYQANKERLYVLKRDYTLRREFGITLEQYEAMVVAQDGLCAICRKPPGKKSLAVDHDHDTDQIRGLLCTNCNQGLGRFKDAPQLLREGLAYLSKWGKS